MICKKCGADISDDSAFCPKCGKKLDPAPSALGLDSPKNNISSERRNKIVAIVFFIAAVIIVYFITASEGVAFGICICPFLLCPILLITGIVKKIMKKPSGKPLYFSGLLFVVFCISVVNYSLNSPSTAANKNDIVTEESVDMPTSGSSSTETQAVTSEPAESEENTSTTVPLSEDEEISPETDTVQAMTNDSSDNTVPAASDYSAASGENSEYIGSNLSLINCTDYSEGRAWVQYNEAAKNKGSQEMFIEGYNALTGDDSDMIDYYFSNYNPEGNNRAAIIDTDGRIVWKSELTFSTKVLTETSEFKDGLAYCIFSGNYGDMFYIIDSDGNVTYKAEPSEDYRIICHDDGKFFVARHVSNFDTDEWQLGVIDKNGNVIYPFKEYSKVYENEVEISFDKDKIIDCCYLGNDILELT